MPRQNGRHFPEDIFQCIFLNENAWIAIKISLKFVPKGPINDIPALVQIMAWHRPGDKPLSEPMMVILLRHICVTWPQWVNSFFAGICGCHFKYLILIQNSVIDYMTISSGIALWWMPQGHIDDKSILLQVMAWCRQATSHFLSQCWRGSKSPLDVTRPQWVTPINQNELMHEDISQ